LEYDKRGLLRFMYRLPSAVMVVKWAGHVVRMVETTNAYRILALTKNRNRNLLITLNDH